MPSSSDMVNSPSSAANLNGIPATLPFWLKVVLFGVAFWFSAEAGEYLSAPGRPYVSFWLPAGIYVSALLLVETRKWPWFLLAAFAANLVFDLPRGTPLGMVLGFYVANSLEALTGAWLVRRFLVERPTLATHREFFRAVLYTSGISTLVGATAGAATLMWFGLHESFFVFWRTWWCNEALAILLVMPFFLSWCSANGSRVQLFRSVWAIPEAVILLGCLAAGTWYLLIPGGGIMASNKLLLMPFLLWAGLRFGLRGATTANLMFALLMGFLTTHFLRGLTPGEIKTGDYIDAMQGFLAISIVMSLVPAIVLQERDRKVEELRESEERFRILTEASFEAVFITENGRILDVNDLGLKLMGYARHEVIGRQIFDCISPETRHLAAESIRRQEDATFKHRLIRKDGSTFYSEARSKMFHLGQRLVRLTAVRDISDSVRAEEALRVSEEKFRSAMKYSPIGMGLVAEDGRWLEVNPALCKIVGYTEAEMLAMNFQSVTHPEDLAADLEYVRQMLGKKINSYAMEKQYLHKSGYSVWVQLDVCLVWNPDGSPRHFVAQIQDISERKAAEEALLKNRSELKLAMEMAKLFHWEFDVESRLITCDENLLKHFGTSVAEQGGATMPVDEYYRKFIDPEDVATIGIEVKKGLSHSGPNDACQFEKRFRKPDGSTGTMLTRFVGIRNGAGQVVKVCGVNQDVTEQKLAEQKQKKLEEQLRQAQKMEALGTLAGGTAHEFNNMLGIITGYAELIKLEIEDDHPVHANLDEVLAAGQRAREIVQQILTFSRQQHQNRLPIQFNLAVRSAIKAVRNTLPSTVTMKVEIPDQSITVLGNTTQIHQVLMNICVNAWHAMKHGVGMIRISEKVEVLDHQAPETHPGLRPGQYAHLAIADDGQGMTADTLARIFEPFFTTKGQGKGTGLGLAVVHGIMQAHEGVIFAQSAPGKGTTFHLYFPVSPKAVVVDAVSPLDTGKQGNGQHILLVDDEPSLISAAAKSLRMSGYQTTEAHSAADAVSAAKNSASKFDLVITDLTMPEMNGIELARELFRTRPNLGVVLASGYGGDHTIEAAGTPNLRAFLQKPFSVHTLLKTVHQALGPETGAVQNALKTS